MRNLKYNIYQPIITLALFVCLNIGCDKERLSPVPQTVLSDVSAFSSPSRIAQQVFGVYLATKNGQFLGGRTLVYQDVRGEDWINATNNGVTAVGVWNFSITSNDNQVEAMWSVGYGAINRANVVLEGIDANASLLAPATANAYKGEVQFCRALCYFYLQSLYARRPYNSDNGASLSIPLRLIANKSPEGASIKRATQAEVFTQILADLNFAETNLPATYGSVGDSNVVRAHKNAAIALKTRVYLAMGNYASVITEANKIVSQSTAPFSSTSGIQHRLSASVLSVFRAPYVSPESIFSLPMTNTNSPGTQNGLGQYWTTEFGLIPTGILADANWKATDVRKTSFLTPAAGSTPARWTKSNDDLNNYVPIIRYAEVLLNLAEALARTATGVDSKALALLNAVRQRSDATTTFAPATKDDLINLILNERRIELLGEGFRSLDIMRLGSTFPAKASAGSVPPTSPAYVWPIPASELLLNPLMTPNN